MIGRFFRESKSNLSYYSKGFIFSNIFAILCIFTMNYDVQSIFDFIILAVKISFIIWLEVKSFMKFVIAIYQSIKAFISQNNYEKVTAVEEITGTPGVGKTSLGVVLFYLTVKCTKVTFEKEYYVNECRALKSTWLDNPVFIEDLKETRYARQYFDNSPFYPHAFSNLRMKIEGKWVHEWTQEHSLGEKTVPPHSVEFIDEGSTIYPTTMHADRVEEWAIDLRFKRQQVKKTYILEQEVDNINKDVRRVVGQTMEIEKRVVMLKPQLMIVLRDMLLTIGKKYNIKKGWYTDLFDNLNRIINRVGVTKWTFHTMSGTESKIQRKPVKGSFVAFCDLPIEYDSRAFRNVSKTRDLNDFTPPKGYDSLVVEHNSAEAERMRKSFENITKEGKK